MSRRQQARAARRAEFWRGRESQAATEQDKALVAWARLRADIKGLERSSQPDAWSAVARALALVRGEFTNSLHTAPNRDAVSTPSRAPGRASVHKGGTR